VNKVSGRCAAVLLSVISVVVPARAFADVTILSQPEKANGWTLFTTGRIDAFFSATRGDAMPLDAYDQNGNTLHRIRGGGVSGAAEKEPIPNSNGQLTRGTLDSQRVRSGFLGNVIGVGMRRPVSDYTTLTGFIAVWAQVESEDRRKYLPVVADVREGYMKLEGPWGSFLAGRTLALFSRGAVEIDFMYGHGYGLGFPADIDVRGPAAGHIGFGVLANGFAPGLVYATPSMAGLKLTAGIYDPSSLIGSKLERTGLARPEAELTYDLAFSDRSRVHLFLNGAWQKLYERNGPLETTAYGAGYGGRLELGPFHVGVAGHSGVGLGLNYALEPSAATYNDLSELRRSDGYYIQAQLVWDKFDFNAGFGATRVHLLEADQAVDPTTGQPAFSVIRQQIGHSAAVVYHARDYLHFDVDYFRAYFDWWLGEKQVVHFVSAGTTLTW
jgi:hypothetical protein